MAGYTNDAVLVLVEINFIYIRIRYVKPGREGLQQLCNSARPQKESRFSIFLKFKI